MKKWIDIGGFDLRTEAIGGKWARPLNRHEADTAWVVVSLCLTGEYTTITEPTRYVAYVYIVEPNDCPKWALRSIGVAPEKATLESRVYAMLLDAEPDAAFWGTGMHELVRTAMRAAGAFLFL